MFSCMRTVASKKCTIRLDRKNKNRYVNATYDTSTEYLLDANFGTKEVRLNGNASPVSDWTEDSYTVGSELYFFALHSSGNLTSNYYGNDYLYYFSLYDSTGNLKHCLLPAQCVSGENTGKYGLFDTKTGTFYPQSGGTPFATVDQTVRTVTAPSGCKKWIGRGNDNKMSTGENWEGGVAPQAGDDLDFTLAAPLAEINADLVGTYGTLYLDDGDIPTFTGSLAVSSCNDSRARAMPAIILPADDYIWNGGAAENWNTAGAWSFDNAAVTWADNNNAIFNTANATATLTANAEANSLAFNADATIDGSATITVPAVSVDSGVSAIISAPTAGALAKIGAGTLTLTENRTDAATTLSEGTLELSGTASLDWTKFTLGTDAAKPVTLEFGTTATLSPVPATWYVGNVANITSTVVKAGGDWTFSNDVRVGSGAGSVASFYHKGGTISALRLFVGDDNNTGHAGTGYCEISGGTITCSGTPHIGCYSDGVVVVTNDGQLVCNNNVYLGYNAAGTLTVADGGSVNLAVSVIMCGNSSNSHGVLNIGRGGIVSAKNAYRSKAGTATLNFDGGTFKKTGGTGNFFPVNGDAAAIDVTVSANGGTLDNNGFVVGLPRTITGAGGMTLSGSGTTTVSADQSYTGTTTVSNETTLSISGGVTFAGPVVFETGAAFDIASATPGVASIAAASLAFPATGTVPLTFNGGAFAEGIYTVCSASGLTKEVGEKFSLETEGGIGYSWNVENDDALVLTVGYVDPNAWTGRGGDGRMSTPGNWGGNAVPAAGADIDLSGISADTTLVADAGRTFGAVKMGSGVITFTNSFAATSFSDTSKVAVGADSTVTLVGDLVFATNVTSYICYSVAEGGTFAVTGNIITTEEQTGTLVPCVETVNEGVISTKGLINNANSDDHFALARAMANALVKWRIGEDGLSGSKRFLMGDRSGVHVMITATTNFTISTGFVVYRHLTLDTAGYEITLGTDTSAKSGGILGGSANGLTTVTGTGKVIVNYNVNDLSTEASSRTNAFTVATGATLALNPSANIGFGDVTVQSGGTLEIQSGTTTFGNLTVEENAILGFNFTDRRNTPVLALYDGAEVTAQDPFTVKVSGTVWPLSGEKILTTCGGFDAEGVSVSLAEDAPRWAKRIDVNADGNIVLDVKPMGTRVIVR